MFKSEYNHTLDPKGRLIVPSKFRDELGDSFVVTKGLDGCLLIYPNVTWNVFEEKLRALPQTKKEVRTLVRYFLAGAADCEVDKQGRILIPGNLRDFASIEKDVVFVGVGEKIEIWSKEKYEQDISDMPYENMDEIAERLADMGLNI
ncbi:MAG: division/cell wall cluster transcriptional repressor MraZ [Lachnospiraceae bacterium]|nr:division/cell wall cluster transcriptional repressor MraZ [Lachnospiraceae bacterium]